MQYLLNEDEMEAIRQDQRNADQLPSLEALTNVVKHVACNMIDLRPPNGHKDVMDEPHGCIHVDDPRGPRFMTEYCDGCSVSGICPLPKRWSK